VRCACSRMLSLFENQGGALIITGYLLVLFVVTAIIQARKSGKAGDRIKEDLKFYGHGEESHGIVSTTAGTNDEDAQRWRRIVANNTENIPIAVTIALYCSVSQIISGNPFSPYIFIGFYAFYAVARTAFVFCYAFSLQPWRSIAYTLGRICELSIIIIMIVAIFKAPHLVAPDQMWRAAFMGQ